MSRFIGLRIPDSLAAKLDTRCKVRGQGKTEVLLEAIERGWDEFHVDTSVFHAEDMPQSVSPIPSMVKAAPLAERKAIALAAMASISKDTPTEEPERRMCAYREYDTETGETYGCRLEAHSAKIKHQRGPAF